MATPRSRGAAQGPKLADTWPIVVATINGMSFVGGLHWHNIQKINSYMNEARVNGATWAADVVAFRTASNNKRQIQAGFAPKRAGAFKGMYSWAAAVAAVVGDNCLAGFKIGDDAYGIVCQLNGMIVAGSDRIVTKDEFKKVYGSIYSRVSASTSTASTTGSGASPKHKIERTIAPAEFGVANEELDITALLTSKSVTKAHRLKALKKFDYTAQELKKYITVGGFSVLALYGIYAVYHGYEAKKAAEANRLRAAADHQREESDAATEAEKEAKNVYPHPWIDLASPSRMLEVCTGPLNGATAAPLSVGGWIGTVASCNTDPATPKVAHIAYTFERPGPDSPTWEQFTAKAVKVFGVAPVAQDKTFTKGTIGLARVIEGSGDDSLLPNGDASTGALVSHFQRRGESAPLTSVDPIKPPPDVPKPPRQEWVEYTFSTADAHNPASRLSDLDMPGVRITALVGSLDKNTGSITWTINGSLYVKP